MAVVLITHKLREALAVADDVTVLRNGVVTLTAAADMMSERALANAMLGTDWTGGHAVSVEPNTTHRPVSRKEGPVVVRANDIAMRDGTGAERIRRATFDLVGGEIVGVAGIEGSGVHERLRVVAGRAEISSGTLDRPMNIGFVPEDRHRDALVLEFTLTENVALRNAGSRRGMMRWSALRSRTRELMETFDIRATSTEQLVATLSGGNQQKLVLARELADAPSLLVVENPTRGLDLRASAEVHDRMRAARDAGMAVLAYSSDLDELLALADRILVVYAGTVSELPPSRELIGQAMIGARVQ